ncbi:MAG: IS21 family transposase [Actinomycetota bacterium]|nr:IS21 family transposase [Actinomycetota bacterium]
MRKIRDVLRLRFDEKLSVRQISASLEVPRATVSDYLRRAEAAGLDGPLSTEVDDAELEASLFAPATPSQTVRPLPDWQKVQAELRRPHVTLMLLWHEYKESFPDGYAYSQFCELYRAWSRQVDVVMRQDHKAGEKLFVDFAGRRIPIYDERSGEVCFEAELFVAALGASGYLYAEAVRSQELLYWVTAHVHAFEAMGGCPAIVVCDNLRSGVTRSHRYEPDVNATYQEMARHYNVAIIPARAYKPRDKSKAEGGVLLAERWIMARLRNERLASLGEANLAIVSLVGWINARPFKKLDGSRRSVFEELDAPALRALPATPYEFATWKTAKVSIDYHIEVRAERHYYSVPYSLVGQSVEVRLSASTVEVFHSHRRVASHLRAHARGFSTDPGHMPESHRRHAEWTPSRIVAWATGTGPATARLVTEIMAARPHPEQGFRTCLGIMRLGRSYGGERLEAAAARAVSVHALSYRSIESILSKGLDKVPLAGNVPQRSHPAHDNLRGPEYYQ